MNGPSEEKDEMIRVLQERLSILTDERNRDRDAFAKADKDFLAEILRIGKIIDGQGDEISKLRSENSDLRERARSLNQRADRDAEIFREMRRKLAKKSKATKNNVGPIVNESVLKTVAPEWRAIAARRHNA